MVSDEVQAMLHLLFVLHALADRLELPLASSCWAAPHPISFKARLNLWAAEWLSCHRVALIGRKSARKARQCFRSRAAFPAQLDDDIVALPQTRLLEESASS